MLPDLKKSDSRKGFTLIELLVVIAIIGILSGIGITQFNKSREKARDAQRKSDLANIRSALLLYYDDYDFLYPTTVTVGAPDASLDGVGVFDADEGNNPIVPEYLASVILPKTDDTNHEYWYDATDDGSAYLLYTHLEGADTDWYWLDSNGKNGVELNANTHTADNCNAGTSCTW
ncbi:MAG: type II secretion system protein [Candidatus Nomurabacteria bacterium]|nr:MAG: type II secretion system protein [Candidatus Nomurabacteria bacterium]